LLDAGVEPTSVLRPIVADHPFGWLGMLSTVLGDAVLEPESAQGLGLVRAVVSSEASEGLRSEEVESVVDIVRATAEAEVAAVLKQEGPHTWNGSLRALGALDVSFAAREMGGGGHTLASGFTAHGSTGEVFEALRAALDRAPRL
jgi:phosphoesterase RecJ-like protein